MIPSVVCYRLAYVFGHVGDDTLDVLVGGTIKDMLALSPGLEDPGRAQQAEMMTDKRGRLPEFLGDPADGLVFMAHRQNDRKAVWLTHKPEYLGQLQNFAFVQCGHTSHYTNI